MREQSLLDLRPSSGYRFLPGLIATCRRRLPDVDLALMRPQFANGDFDSLCVAQEPLVAALPENHALVRKTHGMRPAKLFMAWRRDNDNPALKSVLDKCLDYYRPAPARVRSRGRD
jgi:DNA-binding transcriptional LysR family regulator